MVAASENTDNKSNDPPAWPFEPIRRFIKQSERLSHVTRLSAAGISSLTEAPKLIEAIAKALKKLHLVNRFVLIGAHQSPGSPASLLFRPIICITLRKPCHEKNLDKLKFNSRWLISRNYLIY